LQNFVVGLAEKLCQDLVTVTAGPAVCICQWQVGSECINS
jgi:hypothetical protein